MYTRTGNVLLDHTALLCPTLRRLGDVLGYNGAQRQHRSFSATTETLGFNTYFVPYLAIEIGVLDFPDMMLE